MEKRRSWMWIGVGAVAVMLIRLPLKIQDYFALDRQMQSTQETTNTSSTATDSLNQQAQTSNGTSGSPPSFPAPPTIPPLSLSSQLPPLPAFSHDPEWGTLTPLQVEFIKSLGCDTFIEALSKFREIMGGDPRNYEYLFTGRIHKLPAKARKPAEILLKIRQSNRGFSQGSLVIPPDPPMTLPDIVSPNPMTELNSTRRTRDFDLDIPPIPGTVDF